MSTSADDPALPVGVGEVIGEKYRVDRILGAGGMGVVVAATHLDLERPVAIKLMREELLEEPSAVERLLLEARAAAKIRSEHVARVLDVGTLPSGSPYIVMEYLEGSDLGVMLERDGPLPPAQAVDFVLEACEALAEAHVANIIHRDLKPENLFAATRADGTPSIKVVDFGISKLIGADAQGRALTNPSTAVGSPHYMAPEQMKAQQVDQRADIWALGTILYELICGRKAFDGDTLPAVCALVLGQEPKALVELRPDLPPGLQEVISQCLNKDRDQRFRDIAQLVTALAPFGSAKAQLSQQRVQRVVRGMGTGASLSLQVGPTQAVTTDGMPQVTTPTPFKPGETLPLAGSAAHAWQSTHRDRQARRGWLWGVAGAGVAGAAMAGWLLLGPAPESGDVNQEAISPTPTEGLPGAALPAGGAVATTELAATTDESEPQSDETSDEPLVEPDPTPPPSASAATPPPPRPVARPRSKPRVSRPAAKPNPGQAWDPESFGGRR